MAREYKGPQTSIFLPPVHGVFALCVARRPGGSSREGLAFTPAREWYLRRPCSAEDVKARLLRVDPDAIV